MVGGGTVTEVRVNDDAQALELIQVAVNRREVHIGRDALNFFGQSSAVRCGPLSKRQRSRTAARW